MACPGTERKDKWHQMQALESPLTMCGTITYLEEGVHGNMTCHSWLEVQQVHP